MREGTAGQRGDSGAAVFEEKMAKHFPKVMRTVNPQIQEAVKGLSITDTQRKHWVLNG